MQATRQQILDFLRERGAASVRELGLHLDLTPTGVRQHLTILEREGLVESHEVRGRVGRPALAYRLTPEGEALYPKAYDRLARALLESIERRLSEADRRAVMAEAAEVLARAHREPPHHAQPAERVAAVCEALRADDIVVDWQRDGDGYTICERTCPYERVAGPATCEMDAAYIGALSGMHVELVSSQARGDAACTFRLTVRPARTHVG